MRAWKTSWQAVRSSFVPFIAVICLLFLAERSLAMPSVDALLEMPSAEPVGQFETVAGARLHFLETGPEGDIPVLVLHGASANLRDPLMGLHEALSGRRVIWLDRPGLGHSQRPNGRWSPQAEARLIAAFLYQRGIDEVIVAGHSWGGAIAMRLALDHPRAVSGVVLIGPALMSNVGDAAFYNRATHWPFIGPVITRLIVPLTARGQLESGARSAFAPEPMPENYVERTALDLLVTARVWKANATDMARVNTHLAGQDSRYGEITQPVIIIAGSEDSVVSTRRHSLAAAEMLSDGGVIVIDGAGHNPHFAHAERVAEAVYDITLRVQARRAAAQ